jgi:hypothetical protein
MTASTLVLTALLKLHGELLDDPFFAGYEADADAQARLLEELWEQQLAEPASDPQELVDGWYLRFFEEEQAA